MIAIPEHIRTLHSYKAGITAGDLKEKYGLKRVARLASNENSGGPSPKAVAAIRETASRTHWYPDGSCTEVREKIAAYAGVSAERVVVGNGSEGVISYIFDALFEEGDELLTSEGTFVAVYIWAQAHDIPVTKVPLTTEYRFDLEALAEQIDDRTKAIYLANPNNPTGTICTKSELESFLGEVPEDVLVIVDEAYFEYARILSTQYPDSAVLKRSNVITLRTFSKAFGLAGMRFGYGIGDPEIIRQLMKVKLTFEPSAVAQAAGIGALDDQDFLDKTTAINAEEILRYYELFDRSDWTYASSFGNFVMLDLKKEEKVKSVHQQLLKKGVMTRPLGGFGLPHCLRITVGQPDENTMCLNALKDIL